MDKKLDKSKGISFNLSSDLVLPLEQFKSMNRNLTQTEIIENALREYFQRYNHMEIIEDLTKKIIEDDKCIMIPKELYARINGLSKKELESELKKKRISTIILKIDEDKSISFVKINISDKKSFYSMLISQNFIVESLTHDVSILKNKLEKLEKTFDMEIKNKE